MNKHVIHSLKELYELEKFQSTYYLSQLSTAEEKLYSIALKRIIESKKTHLDFLAEIFLKLDIPIPKIAGTFADLAGRLLGESLELTGQDNSSIVGFKLEKKIHNKYLDLVREEDLDLKIHDKLLEFLLDEEFHALWLQNYAYRTKQKELQHDIFSNDNKQDHPTININMGWH